MNPDQTASKGSSLIWVHSVWNIGCLSIQARIVMNCGQEIVPNIYCFHLNGYYLMEITEGKFTCLAGFYSPILL